MFKQQLLHLAIKQECERHEKLIEQLEKRKRELPAGSLVCRRGYYYRSIRYNGKREQIPISCQLPEQEELINGLKERRYISLALPRLKENLKSYKRTLQHTSVYDPAALPEKLPSYYQSFDYTDLLLEGDINAQTWEAAQYPRNTAFPENLIYQSEGGLLTRSKAEADIATKLERTGLLFRYEPRLLLGKHCYYPDFGVLHPVHRREIYWEHYGKMDDPVYAKATIEKLRVYAEHGYHLGDNLIMTWETKQCPLTFAHINDRINCYFS